MILGRRGWLVRTLCDRASLYSLAGTLRAALTGPLSAYFVATALTQEVQGYFYTFSSLLALQVFIELGLAHVIVQFASHEFASLSFVEGEVVGPERARSRLASLMRFSLRWYGGAAVALLLPLAYFGIAFFESAPLRTQIEWKWPWLCLCGAAALRLFLTPLFALLEGCGQVARAQAYRFGEGLVMTAFSWTAILTGAELWTLPIVAAVSVVCATTFLFTCYRRLFHGLFRQTLLDRVSWRGELLPMQWRIGLSWLSGYFAFQFFTPVLFHYRGPIEAGQFGMTWMIVSSVGTIGAAFINTKAPLFGSLVASRGFEELDRRAIHALVAAVITTLSASLALICMVMTLRLVAPTLAERMLEVDSTVVLLTATVLMQISYLQSCYLRAFKREPYMWLSLGFGAIMGVLTWALGTTLGAQGVVWGYLVAVVLFVLPVGTWIFVRRRVEFRSVGA